MSGRKRALIEGILDSHAEEKRNGEVVPEHILSNDDDNDKIFSVDIAAGADVAVVEEIDVSDDVDEVEVTAYEQMIEAFKEFLETHQLVKTLKLRCLEERPGEYLVYQGSYAEEWAWLRESTCRFIRTSLLRIIQNMPENHILWRYFKGYDLLSGSKTGYNKNKE